MISATLEKCSGKQKKWVKVPNLTEADKARVVSLKIAGWTYEQIAMGVGCSTATITRVLRRWRKHKRHFVYLKSGRPSRFTAEIKKQMAALMESNRKLTPTELIANLKLDFPGFNCSTSQMRKELVKLGYHGRVCVKKPLLRPINKVRRLDWSRQHKNWRTEQWMKVLWSDEKKFELFNTKRRQYCRRKVGEDLRDDTIQGTVKHGGGSVMFWGCFGGGKVGDLKKVDGIMDKDKYHQILVHHAIPSGNRIFKGKWIFMHDNDPKHTSNKVKAYLEGKASQKQSRVQLMDWPSQSPDLNPLELLWEHCDREVKKRKPTNLAALEATVREVWSSLQSGKMNQLVARMPALCAATLKANGGYFIEKNVGNKRRKVAKQTVY